MATLINPARVADILAFSPGWAKVALMADDARLRAAAVEEIADLIARQHDEQPVCRDRAQLALPLA